MGPGTEPTTMEQMREALAAQSAKYARLSAYLLSLTERHATEKNELARRIETLEVIRVVALSMGAIMASDLDT